MLLCHNCLCNKIALFKKDLCSEVRTKHSFSIQGTLFLQRRWIYRQPNRFLYTNSIFFTQFTFFISFNLHGDFPLTFAYLPSLQTFLYSFQFFFCFGEFNVSNNESCHFFFAHNREKFQNNDKFKFINRLNRIYWNSRLSFALCSKWN